MLGEVGRMEAGEVEGSRKGGRRTRMAPGSEECPRACSHSYSSRTALVPAPTGSHRA